MKFTMGRKIGLGFFIVLGLTIIVGATGYFAMKRVVSMADLNRRLTGVWSGFAAIKEQANIYFLNNFAEAEKAQQAAQKQLEENVAATGGTIRSVKNAMGQFPEIAKALDAALADLPPGDAAAIRAMSRQLSERVRKLGELTALEILAAIGAVWSEDGR